MKKLAFLLVLATVAFGCSKEKELNENSGKNVKYIKLEIPAGTTRTTLGETDGTSYNLTWTNGDKIGVYVEDASGNVIQSNICLTYNSSTSMFSGNVPALGQTYPNAKFYAYYPYNSLGSGTPAALSTELAFQQSDAGTLSDDFMIATPFTANYNETLNEQGYMNIPQTLNFTTNRHPFSVVKINLPVFDNTKYGTAYTGATEIIKRVSISSSASRLAGHFTINLTDPASTPNFYSYYTQVTTLLANANINTEAAHTFLLTCDATTVFDFTITVETTNGQLTLKRSTDLTLIKGTVKNINITNWSKWETPRNLSIYGTANCYVALPSRQYMFDANVKGNGLDYANDYSSANATPLASYSSAIPAANYEPVLVWEHSYASPTATDIIDNENFALQYLPTTYQDKSGNYVPRILFKTGPRQGNAIIGLRNTDTGKIVWSWHIWVSNDAEEINSGFSATQIAKVMDRNLGAADNTPNGSNYTTNQGLYYQWGRKDPFYYGSGTTATLSSLTEEERADMIATTAAHPNTLYYNVTSSAANNYAFDWFTQSKTVSAGNMLWGGGYINTSDNTKTLNKAYHISAAKTMFDPCPVGYRMVVHGVWGKTNGGNTIWDYSGNTYIHNGGANYLADGGQYYPACGFWRLDSNGTTGWTSGAALRYWAGTTWDPECTASNLVGGYYALAPYYAGTMYIKGNTCQPFNAYFKTDARPIRCIFEQEFTEGFSGGLTY